MVPLLLALRLRAHQMNPYGIVIGALRDCPALIALRFLKGSSVTALQLTVVRYQPPQNVKVPGSNPSRGARYEINRAYIVPCDRVTPFVFARPATFLCAVLPPSPLTFLRNTRRNSPY